VKPKIVLEEVKIEKQEQSNKIEISNTLQAEKPRTIFIVNNKHLLS
jgi:stress response protein YsnF